MQGIVDIQIAIPAEIVRALGASVVSFEIQLREIRDTDNVR
jgi:hypothetical protein